MLQADLKTVMGILRDNDTAIKSKILTAEADLREFKIAPSRH